MAKKLSYGDKMARVSFDEISRWDGDKFREELPKMRRSFNSRVAQLYRKNLVSHALISYYGTDAEDAYKASKSEKKTPVKDMSRNQMYLEYARLHSFFSGETSTEAGIRKVNREQDIRIFGKGPRGIPRRTMTNEERDMYWKIYDEYNNMYKDINTRYSSETIQQMLGTMAVQGLFENQNPDDIDFVSILEDLRDRLQEEEISNALGGFTPNVFTGRGTNF